MFGWLYYEFQAVLGGNLCWRDHADVDHDTVSQLTFCTRTFYILPSFLPDTTLQGCCLSDEALMRSMFDLKIYVLQICNVYFDQNVNN